MTTTSTVGLPLIEPQTVDAIQQANDAFGRLDDIQGTLTHDFTSDANYTLATSSDPRTTPHEYAYRVIELTDTGTNLTTGRDVIFPTTKKPWIVVNNTAQTLTCKVSGETGVAVDADSSAVLWGNGTDVELVSSGSGGSYTDENARDAIGAALVAGSGISISVDDPGDTITVANTGGGTVDDASVTVPKLSDFAQDSGTTTGLTFGYQAGAVRNDNAVTAVSAGTLTLTDATTSYVEVDGEGSVSDNTTGFTSGSVPLFEVVTSGGAISSVTDKRAWILAAAQSRGVFSAYLSANQSIPSLTNTKVDVDTEIVDAEGWFDTTTNRYTPQAAGYYVFTVGIAYNGMADQDEFIVYLFKNGAITNGATAARLTISGTPFTAQASGATPPIYANGSTDYFELYAYHNNGASKDARGGVTWTYFGGFKVY